MAALKMSMTQKMRKLFFWLNDRIRGGKIRADFEEIKGIIERNSAPESERLRQKFLSDILRHTRLSVPYYSKIAGESILDFPVVNKSLIRDNFEQFRTLDAKFRSGVKVVTSGSTGTPFSVIHDQRKRQRNSSDTIFFGAMAGFTIGQKLYYFKIWNNINSKSKWTLLAQNLVPVNVFNLDDESISELINGILTDKSGKGFLAYSSVYDSLCNFLIKRNIKRNDWNVSSIIAMSESLSSPTKKALQELFHTFPVSRYSNVENGIIAQQLPDGTDDYILNDASFYVEILEIDSDTTVPTGMPGRIVITDLFNYSMPMIRYDTGDIGILKDSYALGSPRIVLSSVEGRRMDLIYTTKGSLVSSFVITNNMWKYTEIKQYQFIQYGKNEYMFKLNTDLPFLREKELLDEFKTYFGSDAVIVIEYVDEIPLLASGKRKKVTNTYALK